MSKASNLKSFLGTLLVLALICGALFSKSCSSDQVLFNNDAPLGALTCDAGDMPGALRGVWMDLNWLGFESPSALPNLSAALWMSLGDNPRVFANFAVPVALTFLGLCTWLLMRRLGFHPGVCLVTAIAAALNMNVFSHAGWGLPSRAWALGTTFLALAALRHGIDRKPILSALAAGLAVAFAIMEAFDVGAIFSLYVAAFAVFIAWITGASTTQKVMRGVGITAIVAIFAAICSAAALTTLIGTQIKGVSGMEQTPQAKREQWDTKTYWSLPKTETIRVLVPGIFGYRMDTPEGGQYWGRVGESPGLPRHSGAGEYAGMFVVLVAGFGLVNAFRKKGGPFTDLERRIALFMGAAAVISLLFAWGRHAPFYQFLYVLPFFSTIRNPIKFMHPFHMALLILFGFGFEALFRLYVAEAKDKGVALTKGWSAFWKNASAFEKRCVYGSIGLLGITALCCAIYMSGRAGLERHLSNAGFQPQEAAQIASFSFKEAAFALFWLAAAVGLVLAIMAGWFRNRAGWLAVLAAGIVGADLMRANRPWILYYDFNERYKRSVVLDTLQPNSYEHRVTTRWAPFSQQFLVEAETAGFVRISFDWLQNEFQYYNVQSLEVVQLPRTPVRDQQFFTSMFPQSSGWFGSIARLWELSNTRYLMGDLNHIMTKMAPQVDGSADRFRPVVRFDAAQSADGKGIDWVKHDAGRFAIVEFTGALPRYKLYNQWTVEPDDSTVLRTISGTNFNPAQSVVLQDAPPFQPTASNSSVGSVHMVKYEPKRIELAVSNTTPSVLLYNDKLTDNWKVQVNGKPEKFLRANFIMRGVPLPAGNHSVIMTYEPTIRGLDVSFVGIAAGLCVLGGLALPQRPTRKAS